MASSRSDSVCLYRDRMETGTLFQKTSACLVLRFTESEKTETCIVLVFMFVLLPNAQGGHKVVRKQSDHFISGTQDKSLHNDQMQNQD